MAMSQRFYISEVNPNEETGGGCICSEVKSEDCTGPYAIFPHTSTDSNIAPHVVLCRSCAESVVKQGVEHDCSKAEVIEIPDEDVVEVVDPVPVVEEETVTVGDVPKV